MRNVVSAFAIALVACGGGSPDEQPAPAHAPFEVRGEAEGLLLVWYDAEGPHTASRRSDIPEEHRALVRVDDLGLSPDQRGDLDHVWVADLSAAGQGGAYPVQRMTREAFDERAGGPPLAAAEPEPTSPDAPGAPPSGHADVVIYGASWCGACHQAAAFLRERGIAFVERDIERDPGAREAMQRAAQSAGIRPSGIPVIDFRGRVMAGFDPRALDRAIRETQPAQAPI